MRPGVLPLGELILEAGENLICLRLCRAQSVLWRLLAGECCLDGVTQQVLDLRHLVCAKLSLGILELIACDERLGKLGDVILQNGNVVAGLAWCDVPRVDTPLGEALGRAHGADERPRGFLVLLRNALEDIHVPTARGTAEL